LKEKETETKFDDNQYAWKEPYIDLPYPPVHQLNIPDVEGKTMEERIDEQMDNMFIPEAKVKVFFSEMMDMAEEMFGMKLR
jgi:hypothetical protein